MLYKFCYVILPSLFVIFVLSQTVVIIVAYASFVKERDDDDDYDYDYDER